MTQLLRRIGWGAGVVVWSCAVFVAAQDVTFSATVDKTQLSVGETVQLTLTLTGDPSGTEFPAPEFPKGWTVVATSQATNISIQGGQTQRSTSLIYLLAPTEPGAFQLGPFSVTHQKTAVSTEPITITVGKAPLPPKLAPSGPRFTL